MLSRTVLLGALGAAFLVSGCMQETTMGGQQGPVTGSAGPNGSTNASAQLERCDQALGVIALVESQDPGLQQNLSGLGLGSPIPVLRLLMQQSNCFMVADRGQAMQTIQQERQLNSSGETRGGANMGGGQLVAADLALTPNIIFSGNTGGGGGGISTLLPGLGGVLGGAVMGSMKFTSAQSVLTLTDVRSGLQISAAQGTATARDMSIGAALFGAGSGGALGGALGGYSNTPEGKVIAASMMDAYNNVVRTVRGMPPLPSVAALRGTAVNGTASQAKSLVTNGNLNLRGGPGTSNEVIGKLTPGTVVTPTGTKKDGWVEVKMGDTVGWVLERNLRHQ